MQLLLLPDLDYNLNKELPNHVNVYDTLFVNHWCLKACSKNNILQLGARNSSPCRPDHRCPVTAAFSSQTAREIRTSNETMGDGCEDCCSSCVQNFLAYAALPLHPPVSLPFPAVRYTHPDRLVEIGCREENRNGKLASEYWHPSHPFLQHLPHGKSWARFRYRCLSVQPSSETGVNPRSRDPSDGHKLRCIRRYPSVESCRIEN